MPGCKRLAGTALFLAVLVLSQTRAEEPAREDGAVRIGMIGSLFRDVPPETAQAMAGPFSALMQTQTGIVGEIVPGGDASTLGEQLSTDKVHLAVFHGIEFAWARAKYPSLKPLMIAVNQVRQLHAYVLVGFASTATTWKDLEGKKLVLGNGTRLHCNVVAERRCLEAGKTPGTFFSQISDAATIEDALDDVVDGAAQVTLVDGVSLEAYKRRKPSRFECLKVIQTSEAFPAAVVAYRPGALAEATLQRFKDGMTGANTTLVGKQLLMLWKLSGFEAVPSDYEANLQDIIKAYPAPTK